MGLEVFEQIEAGADLGAFVQLDGSRGWLVLSTDLLLSSHLHPYTFETGMDPFEADVSLDYFAPHLVFVAPNTLFWPEPNGVQPFDATTGAPLAAATPLPGGGIPTDLELVAGPALVPALPAWSALALSAALAAAAARTRRARAASRRRPSAPPMAAAPPSC
jgi:hypothetical protein